MSYFDEQDFGYTTRSRQPSYASDGTVYARSRSIPLSPDLPSFDPLEQPNSLSPGATTVYAYERPISVGRSPSIIDELDSEPRDLQEPMRPSVDQFRRYRSIRPDTPGVPPDSLDIFEQAGRRQSRASFDSSSAFEDTRSTFTVFEAPRSLGPTFSTSGQSPLEHRNSVDTWNGSTNYRTVTPPSPGWRLEPLNGNPNPTPSFGNVIQSIPLSSNPAAPLTSNHTVPQVSEHFSSHQQTRGTRPDSPVRIVLIPPSEPETNTPDGQGTPMPRQPSPEQRTLDSRADVAPSRPSPGAPDFSQIEAWLNRPGTPADVVRRDYFYSDPNASPDKGIRGVLSPAQVKDALAVVNSTIVDVADAPSSSLRSPSPPPSRRTSFASSNVARVNSPPPPPPSSRQPSVTVVDKPVFAGNERPLKSKEEEIISPNNPPATYIDIIYANGGKPAEHWAEGRTANELQAWLTKPCPASWKLRLIIGTRTRSNTSVATLPFDKETFDKAKTEFSLPGHMLEAAKDHHEFMSYFFENDPESKSRRLGLIFRMMTFDQDGCCLGLSYDPATHSTYALLLGLIDRPGRAVNEELADEIHRSAMSAWHPLLLPLLLLQQRSERIAAKVTAAIGTGFEFDLSRGFDKPSWQQYQQNQKKGQAAAQAKANLKISDFESPILRLSALSADVGFIQLVLELLIATLQKVQALLDTVVSERIVTAGVSQTNDVSKEDLTAQIRKTHDVLLRDIFYIDSVNTSRLLRITQIKEKLQIQLHAIQNLIAQRDNRINMSDSSSVKTISVVIMAFLPGTFIASFFTMPLSDWALDSAVTGQVWKYMVGIVPTAAIAFLAWLFFLWRMEIQRHKAAPHDLDDQQHLAQQTMDGTGPRPQNGRQQQKGPSPNKKGYFVHWSRQRQRERSSTSTVQKRHIS